MSNQQQKILKWCKEVHAIPFMEYEEFIENLKLMRNTKDPRVEWQIRNKILRAHLKCLIKPSSYYNKFFPDANIFFDLTSIAYIAMNRALDEYDINKPTWFAVFIRPRLYRRCYDFYCKWKTGVVKCWFANTGVIPKRYAPPPTLCLFEEEYINPEVKSTLETLDGFEIYHSITDVLDKEEKDMINYNIIEGITWTDIGKKYNLNVKQIEHKRYKIYRKLRFNALQKEFVSIDKEVKLKMKPPETKEWDEWIRKKKLITDYKIISDLKSVKKPKVERGNKTRSKNK